MLKSMKSILTGGIMVLASGAMADVTVETAQGPATFQAIPQTVAAFDVAAIDTLVALGVPVAGITNKLYVDYLDEATANSKPVGDLRELDLEALNALNPDLIVVGMRSARKLEDAQRVAQAIDMTITGDVVGQAIERLEAFGEIFYKQDEAAKLRAELEADIAQTRDFLKDSGTALILITTGPKVAAYGTDNRYYGWIYNDLGLEGVEGLVDTPHGETISFEYVRDVNPDLLIVIDRAAAIGREAEASAVVLDNPLVAQTNAWANDKVVYIDPASTYISTGGYQSIRNILASIRDGLSE